MVTRILKHTPQYIQSFFQIPIAYDIRGKHAQSLLPRAEEEQPRLVRPRRALRPGNCRFQNGPGFNSDVHPGHETPAPDPGDFGMLPGSDSVKDLLPLPFDFVEEGGLCHRVQDHEPRCRGNGTNAFAMRNSRAGAPVALLGVPLRYMHSAVETISLDDLDKAALLLADAVESLPEDFSFGPRL